MHFIKFTESNNEFFQPFYHNKFAVDIDSTFSSDIIMINVTELITPKTIQE